MRIDGSAVRTGMVIEDEGKLWMVIKHEIRTPGNLRAFNQVEMKDVRSGTKKNVRYNSGESVQRAHLDSKDYQYLYIDGDNIALMEPQTFEQIQLPKELLGDGLKFLEDGMLLAVELHDGVPISARLPNTVTGIIATTEPVVKGQTASSSYKPATLENGVRVMVPPFISPGDKIVIKTDDFSYSERAKS